MSLLNKQDLKNEIDLSKINVEDSPFDNLKDKLFDSKNTSDLFRELKEIKLLLLEQNNKSIDDNYFIEFISFSSNQSDLNLINQRNNFRIRIDQIIITSSTLITLFFKKKDKRIIHMVSNPIETIIISGANNNPLTILDFNIPLLLDTTLLTINTSIQSTTISINGKYIK